MPKIDFNPYEKMTDEQCERFYRAWLLECVFERGWTTLKCANMLQADPERVRRDFEFYAGELP